MRWRARTIVQRHGARRASRPQLKRDPLGSRAHTIVSRRLAITTFAAVGALYVLFALWTVRRLWRPARDPYTRMVYHFGVRGFGVATWVAMTVVFVTRNSISSMSVWAQAPMAAVINLPLFLWAGYVWGRLMAAFYGLQRSE